MELTKNSTGLTVSHYGSRKLAFQDNLTRTGSRTGLHIIVDLINTKMMLALLDADNNKKINVGRNLISVKIIKQHPPKSSEGKTSPRVNFGILHLINFLTSDFTRECKMSLRDVGSFGQAGEVDEGSTHP